MHLINGEHERNKKELWLKLTDHTVVISVPRLRLNIRQKKKKREILKEE
jgi:hypothetical protein